MDELQVDDNVSQGTLKRDGLLCHANNKLDAKARLCHYVIDSYSGAFVSCSECKKG